MGASDLTTIDQLRGAVSIACLVVAIAVAPWAWRNLRRAWPYIATALRWARLALAIAIAAPGFLLVVAGMALEPSREGDS